MHEESLGVVDFHKVGRTLLEGLHEEILGIVEFHEVGRTLLEGLHEESLGIVEFLEVLHEMIFVEVLYEVGRLKPSCS